MNVAWLWVAVVYGLAVFVARRAGIAMPWRVAALFYAAVLVWLFLPLTGPYTNLATDTLQLIPPWSGHAPPGLSPATVSNYEMQDPVFQIAPWAHQVRESWLALQPPVWNALSGCGMPLLANMSSEGLSPLRLVVLPLPVAELMTAEGALKMLTAMTFTFLFLRRRYDAIPSITGAIAFGYSGWLIGWLYFPQSTVGAFLPALLWALDLLAERVTRRRVAALAVIGATIAASGHPSTIAHTAFYAVLFSSWLAITVARRDVLRFAGGLAAAGALAAMLAAPVMVPFLESVRKGLRYEMETDAPNDATAYSDLPSLVPALQPRYFGPVPGPVWGPTVTETMAGFAGFLGIAAWFGLLAHVIVRRRFASLEAFFVLATIVVVGIIQDWPVIGTAFRAIYAVTNNHRVRLMLAMLAAAMTAAVLHHVRRERTTLAATLAGGVATLAFLFVRVVPPDDAARQVALVTTIPAVVTLASLVLARRRFGAIAVAAALAVELWLPLHGFNPVRPRSEFFPRTPLLDMLQQARADLGDQPYRIAGLGPPLFPSTQAMYGFEDARMHDPMGLVHYSRVLRMTMKDFDPTEYYVKFKDPDASILDYLNVRWMLTEKGVDLDRGRYELVYDGHDGRVWENRGVLPRFFATRNVLLVGSFDVLRGHDDWAHTAIVRELPNDAVIGRDLLSPRPAGAAEARVTIRNAAHDRYTLEVDAPRHTLIVSSIAFWPGWHIRHDGGALEPRLVNGAFLGFIAPPGKHVIRLRYAPLSFRGGAAASLATMIGLIIFVRRR